MFWFGVGQAAMLTDSGRFWFKLPVDFLVKCFAKVGRDGVEQQSHRFQRVMEQCVDGLASLKRFRLVRPKFLAYHRHVEPAQGFNHEVIQNRDGSVEFASFKLGSVLFDFLLQFREQPQVSRLQVCLLQSPIQRVLCRR